MYILFHFVRWKSSNILLQRQNSCIFHRHLNLADTGHHIFRTDLEQHTTSRSRYVDKKGSVILLGCTLTEWILLESMTILLADYRQGDGMRFPEISVPIHLLLACTLVIVWKVKLHCSFTHLVPNTLYTLIIGPFSILTGSMRFMNCIWWEWVRQQKDTEVQVDLGDWPRCPLTPTWHSIMGILKTVCTSFKKTMFCWPHGYTWYR